tara:strand:+ start:2698 stop:2901 length:204 start_codon:yes stop_codon:yes gene_type:complete
MFANSLPKNAKTPSKLLLKGFCVPRAGVEPARLAALVFETNASTDSATWACGESMSHSRHLRNGMQI